MKKKILVPTLLLLISLNAALWFLPSPWTAAIGKDTIPIAVVVPGKTDPRGKAMLMGARLCAERVNARGGIRGRNLELLVYDDKDGAEEVALEIARQNRVLAVIGHLFSSKSAVAGKIYKRNEIPAISGSATDNAVTHGNEWYFRVIPNNTVQAEFIANYINRSLDRDAVSIVFAEDGYGRSMVADFEKTAERLGMGIRNKWGFDPNQDMDGQAERIAGRIAAAADPGIVFVVAYAAQAAKLVAKIRGLVPDCPIFGSETMGGDIFFDKLREEYEKTQAPGSPMPEHYTEGIYFASAFLKDIVNEKVYDIKKDFVRTYDTEPEWYSACYHDATLVAVEAIRRAGVRGPAHVREDRREIRNALAGMYGTDSGVEGMTGDLFFDRNGDVNHPYTIGIYRSHKPVPAFFQYRQIPYASHVDDLFGKILDGEIIVINGRFMNSARLVYVGIDIVEVGKPDMEKMTYALTFRLSFRYSEAFQVSDIEFANALGHPKLEFVRESRNPEKNETVREYVAKGNFRWDMDFRDHPFDRQTVSLRFRHGRETKRTLIYIPDFIRVGDDSLSGDFAREWRVRDSVLFQDVLTKVTTLGDLRLSGSRHRISHSQINAEIQIERRSPGFALGKFHPVIAILLILYSVFFLDPARLRLRTLVCAALLVVNTACHFLASSGLVAAYLTALDYAFMAVYVFVVLSFSLSVFVHRLDREGEIGKARALGRVGRIAFPVFVLLIAFSYVYAYVLG